MRASTVLTRHRSRQRAAPGAWWLGSDNEKRTDTLADMLRRTGPIRITTRSASLPIGMQLAFPTHARTLAFRTIPLSEHLSTHMRACVSR